MSDVQALFFAYLEGTRNYSHHTVDAYKRDLQLFNAWLEKEGQGVFTVTEADIRVFVVFLSKSGYAAASINRILTTVRSFYAFAIQQSICTDNPARHVKNVKVPTKLPQFLFEKEVSEFCSLPKKNELLWQTRDTALFCLLYSTGCRVFEIAELTVDALDAPLEKAIVRGKGNKERVVFIAPFAKTALEQYLPERVARLTSVYGSEQPCTNRLFINQRAKPLTVRGIQYIIARYSPALSQKKKLSPHALRHSFASALMAKGADIRIIQELLGHEHISTTQRYTHILPDQLKEIYHRVHPHGSRDTKKSM